MGFTAVDVAVGGVVFEGVPAGFSARALQWKAAENARERVRAAGRWSGEDIAIAMAMKGERGSGRRSPRMVAGVGLGGVRQVVLANVRARAGDCGF